MHRDERSRCYIFRCLISFVVRSVCSHLTASGWRPTCSSEIIISGRLSRLHVYACASDPLSVRVRKHTGWNYMEIARRAAPTTSECYDGVLSAGGVAGLVGEGARSRRPHRVSFAIPRHYAGRKRGTAFHGRLLKWFHRRLKPRPFSWS